jgi:hypothetical protein
MAHVRVIKTEWRGAGSGVPLAAAMRAVGKTLSNVVGEGGINIRRRAGKLVVSGQASDSFPWAKLCFGLSIASNVVTVMAGEVQWGRAAPIQIAGAAVTLTQDLQYIGIEADLEAATGAVVGPASDTASLRSDSTHFRTWLYQFRLTAGSTASTASLYRIGHMGNVLLPGVFAP